MQEKISVLENNFENINQRNSEYTLEEVASTNNNYDNRGNTLLISLRKLGKFMSNQTDFTGSTYENSVKPYVTSELSNLNFDEINLNDEEQELYDSFTKNLQFENAIPLVKQYEAFVYENYEDQSEVKNFLEIISIIKYTNFFVSNDNEIYAISGWEGCANACMKKNYQSYNAVKWLQFALNPGADVLWSYASCGWDCY